MNIRIFNLFSASEATNRSLSKYTYNAPVGQVGLVTLSAQACPLVLIIALARTAANLRQNQNLTKLSLFIISYYYSIIVNSCY